MLYAMSLPNVRRSWILFLVIAGFSPVITGSHYIYDISLYLFCSSILKATSLLCRTALSCEVMFPFKTV